MSDILLAGEFKKWPLGLYTVAASQAYAPKQRLPGQAIQKLTACKGEARKML